MKTKMIILKIIAATAICFLISYGSAEIANLPSTYSYPVSVFDTYNKKVNQIEALEFKQIVPAENITEFEISTINTDVLITETEGTDILIHLKKYGKNSKDSEASMTIQTSGQKVSLEVKPEEYDSLHLNFDFASESEQIFVQVPKGIKILFVKTVSGDFSVTKKELNQLQFQSISGDIEAFGNFSEISLDTTSGDVVIENENLSPKVQARSISGDIELAFRSPPQLHLQFDTVSGDFEVEDGLANVQSEGRRISFDIGEPKGRLEISTTSGDFKIEKF